MVCLHLPAWTNLENLVFENNRSLPKCADNKVLICLCHFPLHTIAGPAL